MQKPSGTTWSVSVETSRKTQSGKFPHSFSRASRFSNRSFPCGPSAQPGGHSPPPRTGPDSTSHAPPHLRARGPFSRSPHTSPFNGSHDTSGKGHTRAPQATVTQERQIPAWGQMVTSHIQTSPSQDLSTSSLIRTPQSILTTTQMGKWQSEMICLRSHTHVKHYHIITCSGKMIPMNYKCASGWKEQAGETWLIPSDGHTIEIGLLEMLLRIFNKMVILD